LAKRYIPMAEDVFIEHPFTRSAQYYILQLLHFLPFEK
jgi:hypothetical protein